MTSRIFGIYFLSLMISASVGCGVPVAPPVAPPVASVPTPAIARQVQIQPLTADQLAQILGVQVWTARYSGGPIECWLEIEEEGQSTLPKRIPDAGYLGSGLPNPPSEGTVNLWWTRREDRTGGELQMEASNGSYGYGLNKDAFTFAWSGFGASSTPAGSGAVIERTPGKDFVIVDYDARESGEIKPGQTRRRVHLKLMGRFPVPK